MLLDGQDQFRIGKRLVGRGQPLFVIAEIGLNHGGSLERALALVDAAADAGASAIKLQTLIAADLVAPSSLAPAHVAAASLVDFFAEFELDEAAHRAIVARARLRGLAVMSTPLSLDAVDLLERIGIDAFKIASGDLTWDSLIRRCAKTGKPLVMSSGMASMGEVSHAVGCARLAGTTAIALLHCVSAYPLARGSENLRALETLGRAFGLPIGLSDHDCDAFAVSAAVTLGASLYERHIVLAHGDGSIDDAVSSDPTELAAIVTQAARTAIALGTGGKVCHAAEAVNVTPSRRALYARRALRAGTVVNAADVIALRPAVGLPASREEELIGVALTRDVAARTPFFETDVRRVEIAGAA